MTDEQYMRSAIELAVKGCGRVDPNPMVGAVIVKDDRIIGQGYHARYGDLHAERAALASCSESPEGADMYVTLEPCCHYGKQPPCTDAIIEAGIKRVVVGSDDPNELVAGKGIRILEENGIAVTRGILKDKCDSINYVFFHYIRTKMPYVVMKYAMTADGKTAAYTGRSRWITGETARRRVHEDRNRYASIMAGIGTVLTDDPMLNCRIPDGKDPVRVICDTDLRTPLESQIVRTAGSCETIIAAGEGAEEKKSEAYRMLQDAGCRVMMIPVKDGHIDLGELMKALGEKEIDSVLLEGGATLNWAAVKAGVVNRVQTYIAPKILGGTGAPSPIGGQGVDEPDKGMMLSKPEITVLGDDILLESEVVSCLQE